MDNQTPTKLELTDVQFLLHIVSVCTQRGAFRAEELTKIGQTYDRVAAFLSSVQQPTPIENTNKDEVNSEK